MEKITIFTIYCSTGCSCCSSENHYRGPFRTREEAEEARKRYWEIPLLSSQYAHRGVYEIQERTGEILPDGRIIIDSSYVVDGFGDDQIYPMN